MTPPRSKNLLSALSGGAAAFVFAPLLWPLVIYLRQGSLTDLPVLLAGLLTVAGIALVGGVVLGLLIGFPLLLILQRFGLTSPLFAIFGGAIASVVVFSGLLSWPADAWPLYAFFSVVGGLCGAVASRQNAL